jgi:hypothetical protein
VTTSPSLRRGLHDNRRHNRGRRCAIAQLPHSIGPPTAHARVGPDVDQGKHEPYTLAYFAPEYCRAIQRDSLAVLPESAEDAAARKQCGLCDGSHFPHKPQGRALLTSPVRRFRHAKRTCPYSDATHCYLGLDGSTAPGSGNSYGIDGGFYAVGDGCSTINWNAATRCASGTLCAKDPPYYLNWVRKSP